MYMTVTISLFHVPYLYYLYDYVLTDLHLYVVMIVDELLLYEMCPVGVGKPDDMLDDIGVLDVFDDDLPGILGVLLNIDVLLLPEIFNVFLLPTPVGDG